jgi:hypothetical protein
MLMTSALFWDVTQTALEVIAVRGSVRLLLIVACETVNVAVFATQETETPCIIRGHVGT